MQRALHHVSTKPIRAQRILASTSGGVAHRKYMISEQTSRYLIAFCLVLKLWSVQKGQYPRCNDSPNHAIPSRGQMI